MLVAFLKKNVRLTMYLIVVGYLSTFLFCPGCINSPYTFFRVGTFIAFIWIFLWEGNAFLSHWIDTKISWFESPVKRLMAGVAVMLVYTPGIVFMLAMVFELILDLNLREGLASTIYINIGMTIVISLFMEGRSFLRNWRQSALDAERLQKESVRAQYESLKNQVNPHFLFNSLNALTHLVYEDQDKAARFIKQLSEVYRYVLETRDKEIVPLEEELKFLESYLYLQQIRFGEKLRVKLRLNGTMSAVAPLALQMLIENAIKHNVISEDDPLQVDLYAEDSFIVVENSLKRKNAMPEKSSQLGLENIRKRYEFLSTKKVEVSESGDKFIVKLPVLDFKE